MKIAKKVLSLIASSLAVLIFSGFLSLQPISEPRALAHDADNPACKDITGVTQDIPSPDAPGRQAGISDSGHLDFNADPPAHDFQACTQTQTEFADGLAVTQTVVRGWTWNTNLGYVGFECDQNGDNFGGGCGNVPYETVIRSDGRVRGFAWGDNIGWISMGCDNGMNSGVACGDQNVNYGVRIMQAGDLGNPAFDSGGCTKADGGPIQPGDMYGYAWTDTVGWMNFCGARADIASPLEPEIIIEGSNPPPGIDAGAGEGPVYANGGDFYKIIVRVKNGDTPLTQAELTTHGVQVQNFVWDNKLRADQVTRCSPADAPTPGEALPACAYNGSLPFPASLDSNNFDDAENGMAGYIRAIAPTGAADSFSLASFDVVIDGINYPQEPNRSFEFLPAVAVTRIYSPDTAATGGENDSLFAQRNISTEHLIAAEWHPGAGAGALSDPDAARIYTQLHDCSDAFDFVFDEGGVGVTDPSGTRTDNRDRGNDQDRTNIDRPNSVCPGRAALTIADIDAAGAGTLVSDFLAGGGTIHRFIYSEITAGQEAIAGRSIETDDALGIQTRVQYLANGVDVQYFSKKLSDSSLLNQAADVKGNVRIDVQNLGGLLGGRSEKSIGAGAGGVGISKSEFFNRALNNLKWVARATAINSSTVANGNQALAGGEHFFKRDTNSLAANEPCKIIFQNPDAADINWSTPGNPNVKTTIASRGCDIYINSNLMPSGANAALGIVALEDLGMPKDAPRKGGNVYICATVTDLKNVHIVAENSVLPYGELDAGGNIACGDPASRIEQNTFPGGAPNPRAGLPKFDHPVREVLKNQLVITGSIVSNNTSGGAFKSPPEAGDGQRIAETELMDTARFYDYNFFRYAHTVANPNPRQRDIIPQCWTDNIETSLQYNPYSCVANNPSPNNTLNTNPGSKGIMNIQFTPPPNDLPVFNYKWK